MFGQSGNWGVYSFGATQVNVGIGATVATYLQPSAGQIGWMLKYISGGTCVILPCAIGSSQIGLNFNTTHTQAALAGMSGAGYLLGGPLGNTGVIENLVIPGPASFYLSSGGATSIVAVMAFKGQGY